MNEISLSEAADKIIDIEIQTPIPASEVHLFDQLGDPAVAAWFQARDRTGSARLYDLSNVVFDSYLHILMQGGRRIPESRNMVSQEEYDAVAEMTERQIVVDSDDQFVIASNRSSDNYYHWMVQALPGIDWAARTSRTGRIGILASRLAPWQRDSLRLLDLADMPLIEEETGRHYVLRQAKFSDFIRGELAYQVSHAVAATLRRLAAAAPEPQVADRVIYVARTDSPFRRLRNEIELIQLLRQMGVRVIVPGDHTLVEQIQIFRAARLVIGPHGAGLSNIGFCQPGTAVYEILPRHFSNACFDFLAQSANLHYYAASFGEAPSGNPHEQTWSVDLEQVIRHIDSLRQRYGL